VNTKITNRVLSITFVTALMATGAFAANGTSESYNDSSRPGDGRSALMPEIGFFGGGAALNGDAYKTSGAYQAELGFSPAFPLNLALQVGYQPSKLDIPLLNVNFNTTDILLKATSYLGMPGTVGGNIYIGGKAGLAMYSGDFDTQNHFAFGPTLGFDIPLSSAHNVSLGAEGTYLAVVGGQTDAETPDQISALGDLKLWF
jgi:hypothetical protein